jgi:hypothetical protein
MDSLLNTSGQQLPNNHFVDLQVNWAMHDKEKFNRAQKFLCDTIKVEAAASHIYFCLA